MTRFVDIQFICCRGPVDTGYCVCTRDEGILRLYKEGSDLRPMTPEEREWCAGEATRHGEYDERHVIDLSDQLLAYAVLRAWHMYVQSNCL